MTKHPDGSIDVELVYPPRNSPPAKEAAEVGASAPAVDVNTTGNGGEGLPQETTEFDDEGAPPGISVGQLVGGYLLGVTEGLVPFGGVGHSLADAFGLTGNKSDDAKLGLAVGQIVGGVIATIGGIGGEVLTRLRLRPTRRGTHLGA